MQKKGTEKIDVRYKRKYIPLPGKQFEMLKAIPGVGKRRAGDLMQRFGSIQKILNASTKDLRQVPSVGRKTARHIKMMAVLRCEKEEIKNERR